MLNLFSILLTLPNESRDKNKSKTFIKLIISPYCRRDNKTALINKVKRCRITIDKEINICCRLRVLLPVLGACYRAIRSANPFYRPTLLRGCPRRRHFFETPDSHPSPYQPHPERRADQSWPLQFLSVSHARLQTFWPAWTSR